eukprot:COSAG06_NODE_59035_length_275_cov_0.875000_1_plen_43_part_01
MVKLVATCRAAPGAVPRGGAGRPTDCARDTCIYYTFRSHVRTV